MKAVPCLLSISLTWNSHQLWWPARDPQPRARGASSPTTARCYVPPRKWSAPAAPPCSATGERNSERFLRSDWPSCREDAAFGTKAEGSWRCWLWRPGARKEGPMCCGRWRWAAAVRVLTAVWCLWRKHGTQGWINRSKLLQMFSH